jgi:NAD(P)-dependent dehydrogenase (short-subunit alcohol dehydrogenase family)
MSKKRILLLGASGGLGSYILKDLIKHPDLEVTASFRTLPANFELIKGFTIGLCDTSDYSQLDKLIGSAHADAKWDYILDFTGKFFAKTLAKADPIDISQTILTNLISPIWIAKLSLSGLQDKGKLIFCSSVVSKSGGKGSSSYAASKCGLEGLITSSFSEFASKGLTISGMRLSYYDAGMTKTLKELSAKFSHTEAFESLKVKSPKIISNLLYESIIGNYIFVNGKIIDL